MYTYKFWSVTGAHTSSPSYTTNKDLMVTFVGTGPGVSSSDLG